MSELVPVAEITEIQPGSAKRVVVQGRPVAIVRDDEGSFYAIGDTCTHGDISLSEGFVEGKAIECWGHGAQFDLKTGCPLTQPATEPVPVFHLNISNSTIYVDPEPQAI